MFRCLCEVARGYFLAGRICQVAKQRIEEVGAAGSSFAMADGWQEGSNVNIRMFGEGALVSDVAEEVGLENAWAGKVDKKWGLATTDVEGVSALKGEEEATIVLTRAGGKGVALLVRPVG